MSCTRGDPDQPRDPDRAAAAEENAALALRQAVIGRTLGDADMGRGGELEAAADHRAMQHGDDRRAAELDRLERPVPHARMHDALERVEVLGDFGEIEAGGKMLAFAGQHDRADVRGQPGEEGLEPEHGDVVERVALFRAREAQMRDRARAGVAFSDGGRSMAIGSSGWGEVMDILRDLIELRDSKSGSAPAPSTVLRTVPLPRLRQGRRARPFSSHAKWGGGPCEAWWRG